MCDQEIERRLESAPLTQLPDGADDRIVAAIESAETTRHMPWWRRGIPLWQAAAACLAFCVVTFVAAWMLLHGDATTDSTAPPSQTPIAAGALSGDVPDEPPPWRSDISKWHVIEPENERGST